MKNLWTKYPVGALHKLSLSKYAHLSVKPSLHPLTPQHIQGYYERGRWARVNNVCIKDCPYGHPDTGEHQEWYVGWLDEDESIVKAVTVDDGDFGEWE